MATAELSELKAVVPYLMKHPTLWANYDREADVLYLHFKKPNHADESEMIDDVIVRYEQGQIIGMTIMNASQSGFVE
jgi:uncharacterized protein YuzE